METNLDARRIIAKIGCAVLVWLGAAVALGLIDRFLSPAWGYLPYLGVYIGSGWLVYRLVREDDPDCFLEYIEAWIYAHVVVFTALLVTRNLTF